MSKLELVKAAKEGSLEAVKNVLKGKRVVDEEDKLGLTPLIWASFEGHEQIVQLLLDHGARIDKQSKNGSTALHQAAYQGRSHVVHLLLKRGANPFIQTNSTSDPPSVTPLEWANISQFSNNKTKTLLREAEKHFEEQEMRVMKKFLEQHNLSKYQQFFQEHGLNVAGLTNIKDLDLRKMGIASETERNIILQIVKNKKKKNKTYEKWITFPTLEFRFYHLLCLPPPEPTDLKEQEKDFEGFPIFNENVNNSISHTLSPIFVPNIQYEEDQQLLPKLQKALTSFGESVSGLSITPAVGLYRIREHVSFSVPNLVKIKKDMQAATAKTEGGTTDLTYSQQEVNSLTTTKTFINIQELLQKSIQSVEKIKIAFPAPKRKGT